MSERGVDALVLFADAYPGRKGGVRYLFDFYLHHRHAYGLLIPGEPAALMLPAAIAWHLDPARLPADVIAQATAVPRPVLGVAESLRRGCCRRVGVVGLADVPAADVAALRTAVEPEGALEDATSLFQRACLPRTPVELQAIGEAAALADRALTAIGERAQAGMTEQQVASIALGAVTAAGVKDTIQLLLTGRGPSCRPFFAVPGESVLRAGDVFIFLAELAGPAGYWVETARRFAVGPAATAVAESEPPEHRLSREILDLMPELLRPGRRPEAVQAEVAALAAARGLRTGHLSGHGIGLDVLERPWIASAAVGGPEAPSGHEPEWAEIPEGAVVSIHPHLVTADGSAASFIADTFVVGRERTVRLSSLSHDIVAVGA